MCAHMHVQQLHVHLPVGGLNSAAGCSQSSQQCSRLHRFTANCCLSIGVGQYCCNNTCSRFHSPAKNISMMWDGQVSLILQSTYRNKLKGKQLILSKLILSTCYSSGKSSCSEENCKKTWNLQNKTGSKCKKGEKKKLYKKRKTTSRIRADDYKGCETTL